MKRHHLHFVGGACLLIATILTWSSQEDSAPAPSAPPDPQQAQNQKSPPSKTTPPRPKPFFESPQLLLTNYGRMLKSHTLEDQLIALESLFALPPSANRDDGIAYVLRNIANQDPEIAKQQWLIWKHALTKPWLEAAGEICLALAKDDPFGPSDFISQHIPRTAQLATWERLIWTMDHQAASEVLVTFPRSKRILNITKSLSTEWMRSDPEACAAWLDSLIPTLSGEEQKSLIEAHGSYFGHTKKDFDHFNNRLVTFHQAQNPLTREYLAGLVLKAKGISDEQKTTFMEELDEVLPDYHALLTAPSNSRRSEYYNTPVKFAATLQSADFQNLSRNDQSGLMDRLTHADPEKAAKFLVRIEQPRRLGHTLIRWHQAAPQQAITYSATLPNAKEYQRALFDLACNTAHFEQEESTLALIKLLKSPADQKKIQARLAEKMKTATE